MSDSTHNAILKTIALLVGLDALILLFGVGDGFFGRLLAIALGLVMIVTAVGFWKMQRWAFLVFSVMLLVGVMKNIIAFVVSFDRGGTGGAAFWLLLNLVLIAYVGRWSIERRFGPVTGDHH